MKIYYASDIHSEYFKYLDIPRPDEEPAVIVLAGDIGVADQAPDYVMAIAEAFPQSDIIWIAGNHEFYGVNIEAQLYDYRLFAQQHPRIHFLENDAVQLHGITFLGCTLWTDFSVMGAQAQAKCLANNQRLADFFYIHTHTGKFSAADAIARFQQSYQWLDEELALCDADKTVVITHFPPCREARHGEIAEDFLAAYFQANAKALIECHQPRYWIYGHNHWSDQFALGKTQLVSNQLGYAKELSVRQRFDLQAFIEM